MYQSSPHTKKYFAKLLLLCTVFHLCLGISGQSTGRVTPKITFSAKNVTITDIFKAIKNQTGKVVWFMNEEVNADKKVTVKFENASLDEVMKTLFGNSSDLIWSIDEEKIILRKKKVDADKIITSNVSSVKVDSVPGTITVTGRVTDEKGSPIIGATVVVKGTSMGTTTGEGGEFLLEGVKESSSLGISNIGYLTREIVLKGRISIREIKLKQYVNPLDEAIVIAYGTTTRRLNTGNVEGIKSEDIKKQPVNNPLYALQGRIAGLKVTPTTGLSGGPVTIQIRGKNSLIFNADPLIVIDGLPIVNNITGLGHSQLGQFSALSFINSSDIESIDVLKDADATSIYGSRGANGVILITTRKGKEGQTKIDLNIQSGWASVAKKMSLLSTPQYLELRKEAYLNSEIDISTLTADRNSADLKLWDQNRYTNWQKELIGGTAKYNDVRGSVSGGSPTINYLIGGNYHKETTVFPGDNSDQKGNVHLSLVTASPNQKFKATVNANYLVDHNTLPGVDLTYQAVSLPPNAPALYNVNGSLNWELLPSGGSSWNNPLSALSQTYEAKVNNLITSMEISYKFFPNLTLKTQVGYNQLAGSAFKKTYPFAGRPPEEMGNGIASSSFNTNGVRNLSLEPQLYYFTHIGKGTLDGLIGGAIQNTTQEDQFIYAFGFTSDALLKNLTAATSYYLSNHSSQYKYCAIFGRVNYNWDNKYLLNLTARRDGSSRFGPGNQFGNFSSVGAAWLFAQEPLFQRIIPFISFGKLRFSYGTSGNDGIGDYQYIEKYEPIFATDLYQGARGYSTAGIVNAYYHWESTRKMEFGLETGFLKDRILFTASYFRNRSNNQLQSYPFASMVGPGAPLYNLPAVVQNMGIELTLHTENIKIRDFTWSTSINFTRNRNKLISYPNIENSGYFQSIVGQPFYGQVLSYKSANVDLQTGKYQFATVDDKVTFDPSDPASLNGGRYFKTFTEPLFYGGVSNTFTFKDLSLDVFFQFSKQVGVNPLYNNVISAGSANNLPSEFLNRWQKQGDVTDIQKIYYNYPLEYLLPAINLLSSNFQYVDASFIRLKNLSLSYNIPESWKKKIHTQNLRIYLQGQNLFTITKYKGLDPETQSNSSLPPLKVLTVGFQITL